MQRVYNRSSFPGSRRDNSSGDGPKPPRKPLPKPPPRRDDLFPINQPQRPGSSTFDYTVRVPKQANTRTYHAMKFNANLNIDVTQWSKVNMVRENNLREFKIEDDMPKFGAGSEYGKDARDAARQRKYGRAARNYSAEDQPWLMKIGGKGGKKFKGLREGGVTENASYYVFMQGVDGTFEAYPIKHWYNFTPIQRFKALTAEEAEEEFGRRNKIVNYFSVMVKKKLKTGEEGGEGGQNEDEDGKKKGGKKGKGESKESSLKISEMDEWIESDEDSDSDSDAESSKKDKKKDSDEEDAKNKKKKKDAKKGRKKKKETADSEAEEESDDGDEEGRELDYDSESSASEEELETKREEKGVDEEDAIRKILDSDEDEDEETQKDGEDEDGDKEDKEGKEERKDDGKPASQSSATGEAVSSKAADKKKKKVKKEAVKNGASRDNSGDSSEISDAEIDLESSMFFEGKSKGKGKGSNSASESNSRSSSPPASQESAVRGEKRKADDSTSSMGQQVVKKLKSEAPEKLSPANTNLPAAVLQAASEAGITEEGITRYLMRKPMTAKELLQKFKSKKTGISSEHLVLLIAQILQRLNLEKRKVRDALYFSLKN